VPLDLSANHAALVLIYLRLLLIERLPLALKGEQQATGFGSDSDPM